MSLKDVQSTLRHQLEGAKEQISSVRTRTSLREFVVRYFSGLNMRTEGLTLETFGEFYHREIGAEGVVIATRLQNEFERQLNGVTQELSRMRLSFDSEIGHFNSAVLKLGKQGVDYVVKGNFINNTSILAARDGLVSVAKTLGMDLGKILKFKPWGAINLAKNLNGLLSVTGLALEARDIYKRKKQQDALVETKAEMIKNFNGQLKDLVQLIDSDNFAERFFPEYSELQMDADSVSKTIVEQEGLRQQFKEWRSSGEIIEAEFTHLNG